MKKLLTLAMATMVMAGCGKSVETLTEDNIDTVISEMTLEEKALLVVGVGMDKQDNGENATVGSSAEKVPGAAGSTHAIPRLGIPSIVLADGPAGLRIDPTRKDNSNTYYCTHFPIASLLSSTWNQELVEEVGKAIGNEVLEYGADVLLAPALNIHRNPLNGRNFEYYSEDPLVAGKTAAAYVRGVQSNGVGTSIKHFALNSQETNRTGTNAIVDARTQREIYYKGFEIAVKEAAPWTVMTSYNYINGIYASENKELLQDILRDDWGYKGTVMTDWYGGKDAVAQMNAGNDMLQPGRQSQFTEIVDAVNSGKLDVKVLDQNVKRILQLIVQSPSFKHYKYSNKPDLEAHAKVTRQSATEGMVLLENKSALPFKENTKTLALFGVQSYSFIAGGTGSGNVNRAYTVSLLDGLKNAGYVVDETLKTKYEQYIAADKQAKEEAKKKKKAGKLDAFMPPVLTDELIPSAEELKEAVKNNDAAIITLGRISGEFIDRTTANFNLSEAESEMINAVCRSFHAVGKKVIVVLNVGGVIETASWKQTPDAILLAWQAGQEGGNSVSDVLSGKANPSGKLPMTWPVKLEDHASSKNFPRGEDWDINLSSFDGEKPKGELSAQKKDWDYSKYEEGIYVGYRWFDKQQLQVSYPFGYGLSYTSFTYTNANVQYEKDTVTITVDIANNGKMEGKEVVELYVSAPGKTMDKPIKELKAYAKTALLQPGTKETITLKVPVANLASYNNETNAWEVESGTYKFLLGASSRDIRTSKELTINN